VTVTLLRDGTEVFPAMLDAIAAARREVLLEMYWFDDAPVARRIIAALAERARAGVPVRVLYDAIGSLGAPDERFHALQEAGGKVVEFNPIAPWRRRFRFGWIEQRDHRKILVVDGAMAFVGGLNIGLPWMPAEDGGGGWRDDVARIEGAAAEKSRTLFYETWRKQGGECPHDVAWTPKKPLREAAREVVKAAQVGHGEVEVLGHDAWGARMIIRRRYLSHIRTATKRVLIANSYFLPDGAVRRALENAARRGVEVRVIVPRHSDVPAVAWATRALYARLMKAGVHVHEWTRGVLHAKTALIDGWATTGSYNMDARSWRYNLEANVATDHPDFVAAVERSLRDDLRAGEEVDPAQWAKRPWVDRLREWWFYLFRKSL
jgi:cardiolipin synthase